MDVIIFFIVVGFVIKCLIDNGKEKKRKKEIEGWFIKLQNNPAVKQVVSTITKENLKNGGSITIKSFSISASWPIYNGKGHLDFADFGYARAMPDDAMRVLVIYLERMIKMVDNTHEWYIEEIMGHDSGHYGAGKYGEGFTYHQGSDYIAGYNLSTTPPYKPKEW